MNDIHLGGLAGMAASGHFGPFATETLTATTEERATLALTLRGPVLGVPLGATDEEVEQARASIREWWIDHTPPDLTLPWPVDVTDLTR